MVPRKSIVKLNLEDIDTVFFLVDLTESSNFGKFSFCSIVIRIPSSDLELFTKNDPIELATTTSTERARSDVCHIELSVHLR